MILTEDTAVPVSALPVDEMREHLRLGTGFADDGIQDGLLAAHIRAAISVIEARTDKALLQRRFLLRQEMWPQSGCFFTLPLAPVSGIISIAIKSANGTTTFSDVSHFVLQPDMSRPKVKPKSGHLPQIPEGGWVEVIFNAGFGQTWASIPADLGQAVMLLAAEYYEQRHNGGEKSPAIPLAVQALTERWRTIRVFSNRDPQMGYA